MWHSDDALRRRLMTAKQVQRYLVSMAALVVVAPFVNHYLLGNSVRASVVLAVLLFVFGIIPVAVLALARRKDLPS